MISGREPRLLFTFHCKVRQLSAVLLQLTIILHHCYNISPLHFQALSNHATGHPMEPSTPHRASTHHPRRLHCPFSPPCAHSTASPRSNLPAWSCPLAPGSPDASSFSPWPQPNLGRHGSISPASFVLEPRSRANSPRLVVGFRPVAPRECKGKRGIGG